MDDRELTNYDKFLLKKREEERKKAAEAETNSAYAKYIISELRRTEPSNTKVMTEEEFLHSSAERQPKSGFLAQVKNNATMKKMGVLFLALYVIIVLALALIVMVNAKENKPIIPGADASPVEEGTIQAMPLEETEAVSGNWFDEICDSLNK